MIHTPYDGLDEMTFHPFLLWYLIAYGLLIGLGALCLGHAIGSGGGWWGGVGLAVLAALVLSVANNLLKAYDPDKVAIEIVAFGPGIDLLFTGSERRKQVESLIAQGVRFDICLNTVDTIERETGKRPEFTPAATPVQVGVGQILFLAENGYTVVRP